MCFSLRLVARRASIVLPPKLLWQERVPSTCQLRRRQPHFGVHLGESYRELSYDIEEQVRTGHMGST